MHYIQLIAKDKKIYFVHKFDKIDSRNMVVSIICVTEINFVCWLPRLRVTIT